MSYKIDLSEDLNKVLEEIAMSRSMTLEEFTTNNQAPDSFEDESPYTSGERDL